MPIGIRHQIYKNLTFVRCAEPKHPRMHAMSAASAAFAFPTSAEILIGYYEEGARSKIDPSIWRLCYRREWWAVCWSIVATKSYQTGGERSRTYISSISS